MKRNIFAENMLRFGPKNLTRTERKNLSKLVEQVETNFPAGKWAEDSETTDTANYETRNKLNLQSIIQYYDSNSPNPIEGKQAIVFNAQPKVHANLIQQYWHVRDNVAAPTFTIKHIHHSEQNPDRVFAMSSDDYTTPYISLNTKTGTMYYHANQKKDPIRVVNGALAQKLRMLKP
jgi:hypothetical protein